MNLELINEKYSWNIKKMEWWELLIHHSVILQYIKDMILIDYCVIWYDGVFIKDKVVFSPTRLCFYFDLPPKNNYLKINKIAIEKINFLYELVEKNYSEYNLDSFFISLKYKKIK